MAIPVSPTPPVATTISPIIPNPNTDGIVQISWSSVSDATEYELYRKIDGASYINIKTTTSTSYTDSGLSDGQYSYKIICKNADGDSGFSNIELVMVQTSVMPPPPVDGDDRETDYTMTYILVAIFASLIVIGVFLKVKKRGKRKFIKAPSTRRNVREMLVGSHRTVSKGSVKSFRKLGKIENKRLKKYWKNK